MKTSLFASALFVSLTFAFSATAAVRYVSVNSTNPIPPYTTFATAATVIQQAVNAAVPGDTVQIASGNYTQQVVVAFKSGLTLTGEPGTVLHAFPGMVPSLEAYGTAARAVCAMYRSDVVLSGLHFKGESLGGSFSAPVDGLFFLGGGGIATNCTFSGFRPVGTSDATVARAVSGLNRVGTGAGLASVTIAGNTFTNNQFSIILSGDAISSAELLRITTRVHGNTFTGYGPGPGGNGGIVLVCGVGGEVTQNVFCGFAGTGNILNSAIWAYDSSAPTHGRFVPMQQLNIEANTFTNNAQHIALLGANGSRVVNNKFLGAVPGAVSWGGLVFGGTNLLVANNNFADMPTGTLLFGAGYEPWSGWPALPLAANPSLIGNWFCNVPEPIRLNPPFTVLQGQGTETNCPFAPRFQAITKSSPGDILVSLRGWHGDLYVIESSTNLQHWSPVYTNVFTLPLSEFRDTNTPAGPQRFYRAFKQ